MTHDVSPFLYDRHDPPRRSRAVAIPSGRTVHLTPRDLRWFEVLHRHGPLSFPYLHALSEDLARSAKASSARLTTLFHEGFLTRPWQQFQTLDARYKSLVYDLLLPARQALVEAGQWHAHAPSVSNRHWIHDYAVASVTASIEIATKRSGHGFIYADEILRRTAATLSLDIGYREGARTVQLIPDQLFGIRYPSGGVRFFLVELDRGTERVTTKVRNVKSIERNARQYQKLIGERRYRDLLGIPGGLLLLTITTSAKRMTHLMEVWARIHGGVCSYALFGHVPHFNRHFTPPPTMYHLFTDPWHRAGLSPIAINQV